MEAKPGDVGVVLGDGSMPSLKSLMQLKKKYDAPDIGSLPECYKKNSDKERLYLWSADNFRRQVRQTYPLLKPLCLTSKNECVSCGSFETFLNEKNQIVTTLLGELKSDMP